MAASGESVDQATTGINTPSPSCWCSHCLFAEAVLLTDPNRVMQMKTRELVRLCKKLGITFDTISDDGRSQYIEAFLQRLSDSGNFIPAKAVRPVC